MVDFLQQAWYVNMLDNLGYITEDILAHMRKHPGEEICGLICQTDEYTVEYVPCKNTADNVIETFVLCPYDYSQAEDDYMRILALVHNHPDEVTNMFSDYDIRECNKGFLPWLLMGETGVNTVIYPNSLDILLKKPFVEGIQDCYTTICDYYRIFQQLDIYRDVPLKERYTGYIQDNYKQLGFGLVDICSIQVGDVILMQIEGVETTTHLGVYIGCSTLIHHAEGRLSEVITFSDKIQKYTLGVVRHNANNY